jgi:hypothetical protein
VSGEELLWRKGLERLGKEWAERALRSRHGQPGDAVLDVVFAEPYPTREFVQRWCAEEGNKGARISGTTLAACIMLLVVIACGIKAVVSWEHRQITPAERFGVLEKAIQRNWRQIDHG